MLRNISIRALSSHLRRYSSKASAAEKWNLVTSVCVQRKPVLVKEMNDLEKQVQKLLFQMEEENSWKSDWELQIESEMKTLEAIKEGDSTKVGGKLRRDWEDEWKAELSAFKLSPRITEADKKKDVKSWDRNLDSTLILVVQQKDCGDRWILPNGAHAQGETMRQTAERVLHECCGENLKVQFYGNAPCGFFKFKYPKSVRDESGVQGEKVFFYKAHLTGGNLTSSSVLQDYKWVARNQLNSTLPPDYCKSVEMFLFDEK